MTFAEWALTDAEKLVRVNLTAHDGTSQVNRYIATSYYYDAVNDREYLDRLIDPLIIRRSMNWAGGAAEASVGGITIDNSDREFDDWIDWAWQGWEVEILLGDKSWSSDDSRWATRFDGMSYKIEAQDDTLLLRTQDKSEKLDRPVVERPVHVQNGGGLEGYPCVLGDPQNVTPLFNDQSGDASYTLSPWAMIAEGVAGDTWHAVYENGKATTKSLSRNAVIGGGHQGFTFDVSAPEGNVTCDPKSSLDGATSGDPLSTPGEILKRALTWDTKRESGFSLDGTNQTVQFDENASTVDDFYVGTGADSTDPGWIRVESRDGANRDNDIVASYDGNTRTATLTDTLSFTATGEMRYDVVTDDTVRMGALSLDEVDETALDALDTDPGYALGIFVRSGFSNLELLNQILPGGFYYYWTREGKITAGLLKDPSEDASVFTIDQYETRGKIRLIQEDAPIYRANVGYDRNWTVMTSPDSSVTAPRAAFLAREYRWEMDQDLSIVSQYREATSQDFPSFILDRDDAQAEAKRLMDLFGVPRKRIMIEGLSGLLGRDLNDVITLKDDTYGLNDGKDYRIVMMEERPIEGTVDVELWG